ncbi:aldehyde dehydrogenase domain-containing protein [Ampelomyces quisqualis]|uniref:Aldehyde dehydrogenase domain-containing protein n=1 Tax=Ampelomyces quisqualis TaxID=50730 RepID=A0A6A5QTY4_AMPQU|nr:aldehyde dehydrogenase domain-containing protein [Ampelomyces quisqualis]
MLLRNPSKDRTIYKEEIFGPVLTNLTFDTDKEGNKLAEDKLNELSGAYVYASNIARGFRVSPKIKAGTIGIDGACLPDNNLPFGRHKQSGDRKIGNEGLMAYSQAKSINIYIGPWLRNTSSQLSTG